MSQDANRRKALDMALSALSYPYFENLIWQKFRKRIERGEFDIVHRLTEGQPQRCADPRRRSE